MCLINYGQTLEKINNYIREEVDLPPTSRYKLNLILPKGSKANTIYLRNAINYTPSTLELYNFSLILDYFS